MTHIPVVMATDNNYIPLVVALTSLAENAGKDTYYDIYILIDDSFLQGSVVAIKEYISGYEKCTLSFINVGNNFDNVLLRIPHITRPTYYRLLIPELITEDKCIYLDTDTIVMSDLCALFEISIGDCYVAGVKHPSITIFKMQNAICKNVNIPSAGQYINVGVLLMNLKQLRKDKMVKRFLELIPQNMPTQDQDIINHACYGKIAFIPFKYNVITKIADAGIDDYGTSHTRTELIEAWNRPQIIHYADRHKPWNSGDCIFIDYWWHFCRKSPIYNKILNDFFEQFVINVIYHPQRNTMFTKKLPQIFNITFKRNYVIYGAGKRARDMILFLRKLNIEPEFIVVSNLDKNFIELEGIVVKDIKHICQELYKKSIIIATRECLHKEIIKNLQEYDYLELFPLSDDAILNNDSGVVSFLSDGK